MEIMYIYTHMEIRRSGNRNDFQQWEPLPSYFHIVSMFINFLQSTHIAFIIRKK